MGFLEALSGLGGVAQGIAEGEKAKQERDQLKKENQLQQQKFELEKKTADQTYDLQKQEYQQRVQSFNQAQLANVQASAASVLNANPDYKKNPTYKAMLAKQYESYGGTLPLDQNGDIDMNIVAPVDPKTQENAVTAVESAIKDVKKGDLDYPTLQGIIADHASALPPDMRKRLLGENPEVLAALSVNAISHLDELRDKHILSIAQYNEAVESVREKKSLEDFRVFSEGNDAEKTRIDAANLDREWTQTTAQIQRWQDETKNQKDRLQLEINRAGATPNSTLGQLTSYQRDIEGVTKALQAQRNAVYNEAKNAANPKNPAPQAIQDKYNKQLDTLDAQLADYNNLLGGLAATHGKMLDGSLRSKGVNIPDIGKVRITEDLPGVAKALGDGKKPEELMNYLIQNRGYTKQEAQDSLNKAQQQLKEQPPAAGPQATPQGPAPTPQPGVQPPPGVKPQETSSTGWNWGNPGKGQDNSSTSLEDYSKKHPSSFATPAAQKEFDKTNPRLQMAFDSSVARFNPGVTAVIDKGNKHHVRDSAHFAGRAIDVGTFGPIAVGNNPITIQAITSAITSGQFQKIGTMKVIVDNPILQKMAKNYGVELFEDEGTAPHVHFQVGG